MATYKFWSLQLCVCKRNQIYLVVLAKGNKTFWAFGLFCLEQTLKQTYDFIEEFY